MGFLFSATTFCAATTSRFLPLWRKVLLNLLEPFVFTQALNFRLLSLAVRFDVAQELLGTAIRHFCEVCGIEQTQGRRSLTLWGGVGL
jgi:hypothetical protein